MPETTAAVPDLLGYLWGYLQHRWSCPGAGYGAGDGPGTCTCGLDSTWATTSAAVVRLEGAGAAKASDAPSAAGG
jgi:hypothetical protein